MDKNLDKGLMESGTTTLGMVCKDGIILAADKRATLAGRIVTNKKFEKVLIINGDLALTTAGLISDVQLLTKVIKAQLKLETIMRGKKIDIKAAANMLANLVYTHVRKMSMIQGITGFLIGGRDAKGLYLYELGIDGALTRFDDYATDGSGMMFATGVLEANYKKDITVEEGIKLAVKAINAAVQRDTATGEGIDVVTITRAGVKKVLTKQIKTELTA